MIRHDLFVLCLVVHAIVADSPNQGDQVPSDFKCEGKLNGRYIFGGSKCGESFVECKEGKMTEYHCPEGFWYDSEKNNCNNKEFTLPCGYVNLTEFDCSDLHDGRYMLDHTKCSRSFFQCQSHKTTKFSCPEGYWYNFQLNVCDLKERIPVCRGELPTRRLIPIHDPPRFKFDCSNERDHSVHPLTMCSSRFVMCLNKQPQLLSCPDSQTFDIRQQMCSPNRQCGRLIQVMFAPTEKTTYGADEPMPPAQEVEPLPMLPAVDDIIGTTPRPTSFDCTNRAAGNYELFKCYSQFVMCHEQEARFIQCPNDLVFDGTECVKPLVCLHPSLLNVSPPTQVNDKEMDVGSNEPKNTSVNKTVISSVITDNTDYLQKQSENKVQMPVSITPPTSTSQPLNFGQACVGKENGIYGLAGCSTYFLQCLNEIPKIRPCLGNLFYNIENGMCDVKDRVKACGGILPPTNPEETTTEKILTTTAPAIDIPQFSCADKIDGNYGNGCQRSFWVCANHVAHLKICANGLWWSQQANKCTLKELVTACGAEQLSLTPKKNQEIRLDANKMCPNLSNGLHKLGNCSSQYLSCMNGKGMVFECKNDLLFDEHTKTCNHRESMAICNAHQKM